MKTFIKRFFLAAVLVLAAATAQAQIGGLGTVWTSANYTVAVGAAAANVGTFCGTNNLALNTNVVDLGSATLLSLTFRSQLTTSGTTTNTCLVERTTDGLYWDEYDRIVTTSAGTTYVGWNTNYNVGAISKLRFTVLTASPYNAPITNGTVVVKLK